MIVAKPQVPQSFCLAMQKAAIATLLALYGYYRRAEELIAHAQRDAPLLPALAALVTPWNETVEAVREDVQARWPARNRARLAAPVGHALRSE